MTRQIEDVFYISYNDLGPHYDLNYEDALAYYNEKDCFLMLTKTKNLFPCFEVVQEKKTASEKMIFFVRKPKRKSPCKQIH